MRKGLQLDWRELHDRHIGALLWLPIVFAWCPELFAQPVTSRPASATQKAEGMPNIATEDIALLVKTVRVTLRDTLRGRPSQRSLYHPPALKGVTAILCATLRQNGGSVATAQTQEFELVDGAVAAGAMLGQAIVTRKLTLADFGAGCGLELEWLGPAEFIAAGNDERGKWSEALLHCFEPGVEGIGVELHGRRGWTRPSQVIALNYTPDLALEAAERAAEVKQIDKLSAAGQIRYYRFLTRHIWQSKEAARPLALTRGDVMVPASAVSAEGLDAAIARTGQYLRYRQNHDGWYSEEYLPSLDHYTQGNSAVVQMHSLQGLATYGTWIGNKEIVDAAAKGIARSATFLMPYPSTSQPATSSSQPASSKSNAAGRVLAFPGHESYLEVSGRMLAAMLELSQCRDLDAARESLMNGLLSSQDESGRLEIRFGSTPESQKGDVPAAGIALWAMSRSHAGQSQQQVEAVLARARKHYGEWFEHAQELADAVAIARVFIQAYESSNDARDSELAFQILDRIVARQFGPANCSWPELYGAINLKEYGLVGVDTAGCLAALADGSSLAGRIGDKTRGERYMQAVRAAARFVIQLEFREEGSYYIRSRVDALGGVRTALWNNSIRADHCAEAIMALIRARIALFGSRS